MSFFWGERKRVGLCLTNSWLVVELLKYFMVTTMQIEAASRKPGEHFVPFIKGESIDNG